MTTFPTAPGSFPRNATSRAIAQPRPPVLPAHLIGLGTALPAHALPTSETRERLADLWGLSGARRAWWSRLVDGSGIERRHAVCPLAEVIRLGTAARMRLFATEAPALAAAAAERALAAARFRPDSVTDLIIVTCTGFGAPGIDIELIDRLGLAPTVRRAQIGFMGCFGAIPGLRTAANACCADPRGVALVVCVELCTLHLRDDIGKENLVATALFGDAAGAAVVVGEEWHASGCGPPIESWRRIGPGCPMLLSAHRDAMSWTITDAGFAMTLDRRVPDLVEAHIAKAVTAAHLDPQRDRFAVHPGGAAILEAVERGLGIGPAHGLSHAWSTLRDPGNVSSVTLLYVLQRLLAAGVTDAGEHADAELRRPVGLLAFGPGLTVESLTLA